MYFSLVMSEKLGYYRDINVLCTSQVNELSSHEAKDGWHQTVRSNPFRFRQIHCHATDNLLHLPFRKNRFANHHAMDSKHQKCNSLADTQNVRSLSYGPPV